MVYSKESIAATLIALALDNSQFLHQTQQIIGSQFSLFVLYKERERHIMLACNHVAM